MTDKVRDFTDRVQIAVRAIWPRRHLPAGAGPPFDGQRMAMWLHALTEAMPQLVFVLRADGSPVYVNGRWEQHTGLDLDETIRVGWAAFIHPDDLAETRARFLEVVTTGEARDQELRFRARDGSYRWYLAFVRPLPESADPTVPVDRWIGTAIDITDRKRAEEALRESDRRKNEFLAVLSHELRNPLAPINNSLFLLRRAEPGGEQAQRAQAVIERQLAQLARLVDDLLDVTRIARNKVQLQRQKQDLNVLVRRTLDDHRTLIERNGLALEVSVPLSPTWVDVDGARIVQAIGNLLLNATKFTPRGGQVHVTVEVDDETRRARLRVADTGAGLDPAILPRLFEAFSQADQTLDRSKGGLGLGLALVKGMVELHGGRVSAYSEGPGQGAEFLVELPLAAPSLPDTRAPMAALGPRGLRVLVIEDNIDAAESLCAVLEMEGNEAIYAPDGLRGLTKAREWHPDVVLCDIGLPGMDGYAVARAIRSDDDLRHMYLIALSGYALPEDVRRAIESGFDRHLAKPPPLDKLDEILGGVPGREEAMH